MMKTKELSDPNSCLNRSRDNERIFVLAERDVCMSATIREWARLRILMGKNKRDDAQITEAIELAESIERDNIYE